MRARVRQRRRVERAWCGGRGEADVENRRETSDVRKQTCRLKREEDRQDPLPRETVPCDLCGVSDERFLCEAPSLYGDETFRLVRCRRCSLVYVNPRQEEQAKLAQMAAFDGFDDTEEMQARDAAVYAEVLDAIERWRPRRGRLLDIGCATGGLLRLARERGWEVEGIETAARRAEQASAAHQLTIHTRPIEALRLPAASFDVVVMVHTIEHLYHPSCAVAAIYRVLRPGGLFYSMTPDFHHYAVRLAQCVGLLRDADPLDPTGHPYHLTPRTHALLVERQGFRVLRCGSPIMALLAGRNGHGGAAKRLLRYALRPVGWLSLVVPIGSTIQCVAEKPLRQTWKTGVRRQTWEWNRREKGR